MSGIYCTIEIAIKDEVCFSFRRRPDVAPAFCICKERQRLSDSIHEEGDMAKTKNANRPDQNGTHRVPFERNKKIIYATQTVCGICGQPVDFSIKFPDPLSPCIDHIIPIDKGGHPSDIANLQLAHMTCNRQKANRIMRSKDSQQSVNEVISNRVLPLSRDWSKYKP